MTSALKPNKFRIALATGVITLVLSTKSVDAQSICENIPISGDYAVPYSADGCYISPAGTADGIDNPQNSDASTTNTAVLTVTGTTLYIPAGTDESNVTKTYAGSIVIGEGGSIVMGSGNLSIEIGKPLYIADVDGDGYPDSDIIYEATAAGRRRKGLAKSFTATDCDPTDSTKWQLMNSYTDADGDGYSGATPSEGCYGDSPPGGGTPGDDCYDNNAYAYPSSTYCMTTHRGDNSFDYNCSNTQTLCGTTYNRSCSGGSGSTRICIGSGSTNCGSSSYTYYASATFTCGQTGCYGTGTGTDYNSCTTKSSSRCSRGSSSSYTSSVASGVQACQ